MSDDPASDKLEHALRDLPVHAPPPQAERPARAAFVRAFDESSGIERLFESATRVAVPAVLAGVVGLYLSWAFSSAIALVH